MLYIVGAGHAHPEGVIDNKFIEELDVGTSEEWILEKIGIETRATSLPLQYIASTRNRTVEEAVELSSSVVDELAIKAINMALDRARVTAEEIGMILCNCCTPRYTLPSQSERIAKILNIDVPSFDVYTACPAFALHIDYLNKFNPEKLPKYVLCFSTAALTQHVNYNDRSDGAIWGDGAAAWIISPIKRGKLAVIDSVFEADPTRSQSVVVDTYGHFHQDGRAVRDFSVRQTVRLIKRLEAKYNIDWSRDIFIGHQANATMLRQICNNRKIPPSNH
ncbi:MAG: ketoacyl-ACP synthase III, partial [Candidatus Dadabacteria bacterium]